MGKYLIITFLLLPLSLITNIENDFNGVEPLKRNLNSQTIDVFTYDADYFTNIAANEAALTYQVEIEGNLNNSRTDDDYYYMDYKNMDGCTLGMMSSTVFDERIDELEEIYSIKFKRVRNSLNEYNGNLKQLYALYKEDEKAEK